MSEPRTVKMPALSLRLVAALVGFGASLVCAIAHDWWLSVAWFGAGAIAVR